MSNQIRPGRSTPPSAEAERFERQQSSPFLIPPQIVRPEPPSSSLIPTILIIAAALLIAIVGFLAYTSYMRMRAVEEMAEAANEILALAQKNDLKAQLVGRWRKELETLLGERILVDLTLNGDGTLEARIPADMAGGGQRRTTGVWHVREGRLHLIPARDLGERSFREHAEEIVAVTNTQLTVKPHEGPEKSVPRIPADPNEIAVP